VTWINRLRLLGGVLAIVLLVAILTLIFNQRQTKVASLNATVSADQYDLSAAYGGTVTEQFVKEGVSVKKGDKLFSVQSVALQQDVNQGLDITSTEAYDVDKSKGIITYKAVVNGKLTELKAKLGNTLATGNPFATISVGGTEFVVADYLLSPRDYERVEKGAHVSVLLPNNETVDGTVTSTKVQTNEGQAQTQVRVDSKALTDPALDALTEVGTPVTATLELRDDGPLAGVSDMAFDFLRQIGLK
jgi:multidrug resistance efflux pump